MRTLAFVLTCLLAAATAWAGSFGEAVEVRIRSDNGTELTMFPVASKLPNRKVYAEASKGDNYTIMVRNRLNRRVGIVVAVDGRNIISGKKSWLGSQERMYILEPNGVGEYKGWRTGDDRINRFYFTTVADSYAAAFKDESAMGVIAVAVYPEIQPIVMHDEMMSSAPRPTPSMAKKAGRAAGVQSDKSESAGTGYGQEEYSPVMIVQFEPEQRAAEKIYVKYEWREALCRKGVIACRKPAPRPYNRIWDNDGYAPPPPGRS